MGSIFSQKTTNIETKEEQDKNEIQENENDLKIELYPKNKARYPL